MPEDILDTLLQNYTALVERIDAHTARVSDAYKDQMVCRKGCDSCCRFLSLFPVEALSLAAAFERLAPEDQAIVEARIRELDAPENQDNCPLLIDRACMLYSARPVICRTHGFPIYIEKEEGSLVDFCPENFKAAASFPKEALLSLEQLNTMLAAVNTHFLSLLEGELPDRIPIDQALYLCRSLGLPPETDSD
jgi:Fe-S-cluster containining protein